MFDVKKTKQELVEWVRKTVGDCTVVIGISGGKDSSVTAALCVEALGNDKVFGVLMPDGEQKDIDKSLELCHHLGIAYTEVNIGTVTHALRQAIGLSVGATIAPFIETADLRQKYITEICGEQTYDKNKYNDVYETNTPARIRMTTLYGVAAIIGNARVANTCNLSEDWVGYSTKFGDSAGDFSPLANLTVSEVKALGYELGLPKDLIEKTPTDGMSGKSDEEKLGFSYPVLERYILTGEIDSTEAKDKIDRMHKANIHKMVEMPKFKYRDVDWYNLDGPIGLNLCNDKEM